MKLFIALAFLFVVSMATPTVSSFYELGFSKVFIKIFLKNCFRLVPSEFKLWRRTTLRQHRKIAKIKQVPITIQKNFLIWISCSFKKGASDKTISYFDQSFRFSGLWLIWPRDLGRSGQNKSWGTEREQIFFFLNFEHWGVS